MRLQQVAEGLWQATEVAKRLRESDEKYDLLEVLTKTRADLTRFSEAIQATLDDLSKGLDRL